MQYMYKTVKDVFEETEAKRHCKDFAFTSHVAIAYRYNLHTVIN